MASASLNASGDRRCCGKRPDCGKSGHFCCLGTSGISVQAIPPEPPSPPPQGVARSGSGGMAIKVVSPAWPNDGLRTSTSHCQECLQHSRSGKRKCIKKRAHAYLLWLQCNHNTTVFHCGVTPFCPASGARPCGRAEKPPFRLPHTLISGFWRAFATTS